MTEMVDTSPWDLQMKLPVPRPLDQPFKLEDMTKLEDMAESGGPTANPWVAVGAFLAGVDPYWAGWARRLIEIGAHLHCRRFSALQSPDGETSFAMEPDDACLLAESRRLLAASGVGAWPDARWQSLVEEASERLSADAADELRLFLSLPQRERASIVSTVHLALSTPANARGPTHEH